MNKQKGNTLAIVMILLVIITITGTLAIRQSLVSLGVATNSQAQQLLLQNSDSVHFSFENLEDHNLLLMKDNLLGMITDRYKGDEIQFCYKGKQKDFFDREYLGIFSHKIDGSKFQVKESGDPLLFTLSFSTTSKEGMCQLDDKNDFTSGRKVVMTQISVISPDNVSETEDIPFAGQTRGTDQESVKLEPDKKIIINAISFMPTLSTASTSEINECLKGHSSYSDDADLSISKCLNGLNVPFTTYTTEYMLGQVFE